MVVATAAKRLDFEGDASGQSVRNLSGGATRRSQKRAFEGSVWEKRAV
jgi:hypothetical protein